MYRLFRAHSEYYIYCLLYTSLRLLVGLGGQGVQPFLLPLDFELGDGQVFFSAAALTALYVL